MFWIFPALKKRVIRAYRNFLRWLFWGISQKLKQLKSKCFAMSV